MILIPNVHRLEDIEARKALLGVFYEIPFTGYLLPVLPRVPHGKHELRREDLAMTKDA